MNYGAIGSIIGHEISHGFDDQGSQFDKNGNVVEWRTENSKKKFLEEADCMIKQYSSYVSQTVGLNVSFNRLLILKISTKF